jgi:hypothetical protein
MHAAGALGDTRVAFTVSELGEVRSMVTGSVAR